MKLSEESKPAINVFPSRGEMGGAAGRDVERRIIQLLETKDELRMVFAAAPSQNELLDYLAESDNIEWSRVVAFHMDEYLGLPAGSDQLFSSYLKNRLFDKVNFKKVNIINGNVDSDRESVRYSGLIGESPIDIVCLGIGENGHIAFNDPPVADFNDPEIVKKVSLDHTCRRQQVNEGCFESLDDVPVEALTLTIPVIMNAEYLFCTVPGLSKYSAVFRTFNGSVDTSCPASVLRTHPDCRFYFDIESYEGRSVI